MSRLQPHHCLTATGEAGKCSVPMWCNGLPDGFCDRPAYGVPLPYRYFVSNNGERVRLDGGYVGYVPALACPAHGGPKSGEKEPV